MKKAGLIFILFLGINSVFGQKKDTIKELYKPSSIQNPLTKKGVMFVFWGWNRGCIRMAGRQPRQKVAGNKARRTCHYPPDVRL